MAGLLDLILTVGGFLVVFVLTFAVSRPLAVFWAFNQPPKEPEMSDRLLAMTELADEAIAARQAGRPLPPMPDDL